MEATEVCNLQLVNRAERLRVLYFVAKADGTERDSRKVLTCTAYSVQTESCSGGNCKHHGFIGLYLENVPVMQGYSD